MLQLLIVLTPISLLDSMSAAPLFIVPLAVLLGGCRPLTRSLMLVAGIVVTYLPFGVLLLFGLDAVFDQVTEKLARFWNEEPDTLDLLLQLMIGGAMLAFGYRLAGRRESRADKPPAEGMTAGQAFVLAAVLNLTGMWGALPYFAAIDQILRADLNPGGMLLAVVYYNLVFVVPLLAFIALRYALGARGDRLFQAATDFLTRWGRRLIMVILTLLGSVLVADGVGWFLGMPLLPVFPDAAG